MVDPLFLALSQVPILGWLPIVILLLGIDEGMKIVIIGWSAFIPVVLNTSQGVRDVPQTYRELGRVLSFSGWSVFKTIVVPSAVPSVFTGLREGLANSWQTLVAVELIASFEGLGYLMAYGRQLFQLEMVISAMIVVGLIGLAIHGLLALAENHLQRWRPEIAK
jgi:sulfonate transport system permease protein